MDKKQEYPNLWQRGLIPLFAKKRANWMCEHCGMAFDENGKSLVDRRRDGQPFVLTVHHINGDKQDCSYKNLLSCCQRCHLHIQGVWKPNDVIPSAWNGVPDWIKERGLGYMVQHGF